MLPVTISEVMVVSSMVWGDRASVLDVFISSIASSAAYGQRVSCCSVRRRDARYGQVDMVMLRE
jgi:hypothetical protein